MLIQSRMAYLLLMILISQHQRIVSDDNDEEEEEVVVDNRPWYPTGSSAVQCTIATQCCPGSTDYMEKIQQHEKCRETIEEKEYYFSSSLIGEHTKTDIIGAYDKMNKFSTFCGYLEEFLPLTPTPEKAQDSKKYDVEDIWNHISYDYFCTTYGNRGRDMYVWKDASDDKWKSVVKASYCTYLEKIIVATPKTNLTTHIDGYRSKKDEIERGVTYVFFCDGYPEAKLIRERIKQEIDGHSESFTETSKNLTTLLCEYPGIFYKAMKDLSYGYNAGGTAALEKFKVCMREILKECLEEEEQLQ